MTSKQKTLGQLKKQFCRIKGCDKKARNGKNQVCEMHYHRMYRTGSYDLIEKPVGSVTSHGYRTLTMKGHPLSGASGKIYEHRYVYFDHHGVENLSCALCGKRVSIQTGHVDHIDENKLNNSIDNLRMTCSGCNTGRNRVPPEKSKGAHLFEYKGKITTANQWAKDPRVKISGHQIVRRRKSGMCDKDCLFSLKVTHKNVG